MNKIINLFKVKYPIIQGGMVWVSGWRLASAVSNAGGLGLIGAGSMTLDVLREHIAKCKKATNNPFGVNVPLLYSKIDEVVDLIIEENVKIVFTSAGNPKKWTAKLKAKGIIVVHVVSSLKFALKAEQAGVDAIVAEGFEAGGHNGREETTTLVLIPTIKDKVKIPVIAAGGISTGKAMMAAMIVGADAVQIGSRFVNTIESSAHINFKKAVINTDDGGTFLTLKEFAPIRMVKNVFFSELMDKYKSGASKDEIVEFCGHEKAKNGMFGGDFENGILEIGQVSSLINDIVSAKEVIENMVSDYNNAISKLSSI